MDNMDWLAATTGKIPTLIENRKTDVEADHLIGLYFNDVREVMGYEVYQEWLMLNERFGLSQYMIDKLRSEAKEN